MLYEFANTARDDCSKMNFIIASGCLPQLFDLAGLNTYIDPVIRSSWIDRRWAGLKKNGIRCKLFTKLIRQHFKESERRISRRRQEYFYWYYVLCHLFPELKYQLRAHRQSIRIFVNRPLIRSDSRWSACQNSIFLGFRNLSSFSRRYVLLHWHCLIIAFDFTVSFWFPDSRPFSFWRETMDY